MNKQILLFATFLISPLFAGATTDFQVKPDEGAILLNVSGDAAKEIFGYMSKAQVDRSSTMWDITFEAVPLVTIAKGTGDQMAYRFFTHAPLSDTTWQLTSSKGGGMLYLDNASSKVLYGIMQKAGVQPMTTGGITKLNGVSTHCEERNADSPTPTWACFFRNFTP